MPSDLLAQYRADGIAILPEVLPQPLLERLRLAYLDALQAKVARLGLTPFESKNHVAEGWGRPRFVPVGGNHDVNRWNMHLPSRAPFLDDRLLANSHAMEVVDSVLGPSAVLAMMASDTPFPGAADQTVHQDALVSRIAVNVALVDFTEENGPLEYWPGTHSRTPSPDRFDPSPLAWSEDEVKRIVSERPSKRLVVPAGTMIIRDHRILHRGTAHRGTEPRPMLSLLYFSAHDALPHREVVNGVAWAALQVRQIARRAGSMPWALTLLNRANAAGRIAEYLARSDRDYRRPIPRDSWRSLSERTRHLLRYATVEDSTADEARSPKASVELVRSALRGMSAAIGGADRR